MFSLGKENDDGISFGGGAPRSTLNSLFGSSDQSMDQDSNDSLTYKAPKPPGKNKAKPEKQASAASGVAIAVAVNAYRLINNQYNHQGKLGIAILKNPAAKDFKILMYVSKQKPVSTCQINSTFTFTVQANNYASFSDDQKQTWSILFENNKQITDFAKQICIAKFSSQATPSNISIQDLSVRDTTSGVESGDSLEVKYTGWLLNPTDGNLGAVFDSNHNSEKTFRFKTGKGKVIKGWESGMLGMQKGGKRFIVIPPQLAYGPKQIGNKVPPNSTLTFEVDLLRMKQAKDTSSVKSSESVESLPQVVANEPTANVQANNNAGAVPFPGMPVQADQAQPGTTNHPTQQVAPTADFYRTVLGFHDAVTPAFPYKAQWLQLGEGMMLHIVEPANGSLVREEPVKVRTASLNDHMSQVAGDTSKTDLMSRMARVGQAMLPLPGGNPGPAPTAVDGHAPVHAPEVPQAAAPPIASVSPQHPGLAPQTPHSAPLYNPPRPSTPNYYPSPHHATYVTANQHLGAYQPTHQTYYDAQHQQQTPMAAHSTGQDPSLSQAAYNSFPAAYRNNHMQPNYSSPVHGPGSDFFPLLVTESRQHGSELRILQEKVDKVSGIVEEVRKQTDTSSLSSSQTMDPALIMHNIQRIMQENERLKEQAMERNKQIEAQNDKIGELLQQNQRHVEKSNLILEQRNDTFKESFQQSQARSLQLEQDKVALTQNLSDSTSRVSELTQELSNAKQRESELRQKFKEVYVQEKQRADEAEQKVEELQESLDLAQRSESTRDVETEKMAGVADKLKKQLELAEAEKSKLRQGFSDQASDLQRLESEKSSLEERLASITDEHRVQMDELKNSSTQASDKSGQLNQKIKELQSELNEEREKFEKASEEKEATKSKLEVALQRFTQLRQVFEEQRNQLNEANEEQEEAALYQERYEKLRSQAGVMKQRFEERMEEMRQKLDEKGESPAESGDLSADQLIAEVKKVMNSIFQRVRSHVSPDKEYAGSQVVALMLQIIKTTTLELMSRQTAASGRSGAEQAEVEEENESSEAEEEGEPDGNEGGGEQSEPALLLESQSQQTGADPTTLEKEKESKDEDPNEVQNEQKVDVESGKQLEAEAVTQEVAVDQDCAQDTENPSPDAPETEERVKTSTGPNKDESLDAALEASTEELDTLVSSQEEQDEEDIQDDVTPDAAGADDVMPSDATNVEQVQKESVDADLSKSPPDNREDSTPGEVTTPCSREESRSKGDANGTEDSKEESKPDEPKDEEKPDQPSEVSKPGEPKKELKLDGPKKEPNQEAAGEDSKPSMNQIIADAIFNEIRSGRDDGNDVTSGLSRSSSKSDDKPGPPPLFDDDSDSEDDDLGWLSK